MKLPAGPKRLLMKFISSEFPRFILFGGVNSLVTYGIYLLLRLLLAYPVAYTGSYVSGIFISYLLYTRFVFKSDVRLSKALQYPIVYVAQYLLSVLGLLSLVEYLHISELGAPILVVVLTMPVTYFLSRFIIIGHASGN